MKKIFQHARINEFSAVVDKREKRLDNRSGVRFRMSDDRVPKLIQRCGLK